MSTTLMASDVSPKLRIDFPMAELEAICLKWKVRKLAIFGSAVRDDFTDNSDVDVLYRFEPGHTLGWNIVQFTPTFPDCSAAGTSTSSASIPFIGASESGCWRTRWLCMSVNDPQTRLGHMLDMAIAASEIAASTTYDEFLDSLMHQLAIVRALEVTGEAAAHVDQETRDSISGIPWS